MNIISLEVDGFKRARNVKIVPDQNNNLVLVAGNNGAGKTSITDSIAAALTGVNKKTTPKPIRDGADRAEIILETDELTVTRKFTPSGSTLTVQSKDGAKFSKGQAKLDELVGKLSMDPFAFTLLDDKNQLAQLLDLVDLPFDPERLEAERATAYAERTNVNRSVKEYEEQLKAYGQTPEGLPPTEVSVSELLDQYRAGQAHNAKIQNATTEQARWRNEITRLEQDLGRAKANLAEALNLIEPGTKEIDLDEIQLKIDGAEHVNQLVRKQQERGRLEFKLETTRDEAQELTDKLDQIAKTKADGLAAAKFPVEGLGFDENGVTYQGVPFKQASTAEQIRVSMGMAIALNPKLRVIRINDGSLLDNDSLALIDEMAREHDYQVWIELVGEDHDGAYIIVDGEVQA